MASKLELGKMGVTYDLAVHLRTAHQKIKDDDDDNVCAF